MRTIVFDFTVHLVTQLALVFSAIAGYVVVTQSPHFADVPHWYKLTSVLIGVTVAQTVIVFSDRLSQTTGSENGNDSA